MVQTWISGKIEEINMNIIQALRTYDVYSPKLRIGNKHDGGYIINELIAQNSTRLISIGMGSEDEFERDWFSKYHTYIEAYDGTYPCQHMCTEYRDYINKKIFYVNHNVGYGEKSIPLETILADKQNTLLKVDVEGAEYTIFDNVRLNNFTGLILEVHHLHVRENQTKLVDLINNNFSDLILFHIHANSWGNTFPLTFNKTDADESQIENFPYVIELSFVNKKFIETYELEKNRFPVAGLDASNNSSLSDIELNWVNSL